MPLEPGRLYDYTLTARLQPNNYTVITRTRRVEFRAGEAVKFTVERPDDRAKVRFVPTPDLVIEEMMNLRRSPKTMWCTSPGAGTRE